ncbi:MAG: phage holin family protein [Bacteroidetes bacterium]|nr:phage holin family protein [Bacteroidota bacterium]
MPEQEKIELLTNNLKNYVNTNCELIKFQIVNQSSSVGAGFVSGLLIAITGILLVLFLSIGAGFYMSAKLGDAYSGFGIVAGFYFILVLVLIIGRKKLVEIPLRNKIIEKLLSTDQMPVVIAEIN